MRPYLFIAVIVFFIGQINLVQGLEGLESTPALDVSRIYRHHGYVEQKVRRDAQSFMNHAIYHQRNVIPSVTASAQGVSSSGTTTSTDADSKWNDETDATCLKSLRNTAPSNPSGMTACYNIRSWDKSSGVFQADLRLYRISSGTGDWASLKSTGANVLVSCPGASIAPGNMKIKKRKRARFAWRFAKRSANSPQMLQLMSFYGKVHDDQMDSVNKGSARSLLTPTIAFSGMNEKGKALHVDLAKGGAMFVAGVFADHTAATVADGPRGSAEFQLPGTTLGIFPVGLIITGVWAVLFILTLGMGTINKIRFREAFRRRMKREMNMRGLKV